MSALTDALDAHNKELIAFAGRINAGLDREAAAMAKVLVLLAQMDSGTVWTPENQTQLDESREILTAAVTRLETMATEAETPPAPLPIPPA